MKKPAESSFALTELVRERWSPVGLSSKKIEPGVLGSLFEAARWAPSSYNEQPWAFCVATQDHPESFAAMLGCLVEANQKWAKQAYALVISCAKLNFARNDKPNRHAYHDVGLATENLFLQALSQGIYCHAMAGFDADKARIVVQIPATHDPVAAIAIGYPAAEAEVSDDLQQRDRAARVRKPLTDQVFTGRWGKFAGPFG
ncbi:MAG: nitroreductase family protein [Planctomycetaceae bacterium]|nr:nitroreductase family protein [Planctomycetaceae bacterium]